MTTIGKKPIHISVDGVLKEDAEKLFNDLGLNMTTAITIFLKQSVRDGELPFQPSMGNAETLQAIKDVKDGKIYGGFSSVSDLMDDLNA